MGENIGAELEVAAEEERYLPVSAPQPQAAMALVQAESPTEFIAKATEVANALAGVIEDKKLFSTINGRRHVLYEGWTALGALIGATMGGASIFPVVEWTRSVKDDDGNHVGWEARVNAQTSDGRVIASAEAQCLRTEKHWQYRDDFALRSMAQTRAGSKALRQPLGFIMVLAGYDATPKEEMGEPAPAEAPRPRKKKVTKATLEKLAAAVSSVGAYDPSWEEMAVLESARRKWSRDIPGLADLYEDEAKQILEAAQKRLERDATAESP